MSPSFHLLFLFAGLHCTLAFNTGRPENGHLINEYQPLRNVNEERFRRAIEEDEEIIPTDDEEIEKDVVTDKQMIKSIEDHQLPEGEYEDIPEVGSRAKRAAVTITRLRNRRTGKVAYTGIRKN